MEFRNTLESVAKILAQASRMEVTECDQSFVFSSSRIPAGKEMLLAKLELSKIIERVARKDVSGETAIYDGNTFEQMVREESPIQIRRFREERVCTEDPETGIIYELSYASDDYIAWFFAKADELGTLRDLFMFPSTRAERYLSQDGTLSIFEYIRSISMRLLTLKITSPQKTPLRRFSQLSNSMLFNFAFNMDISFVPQRYFDEVLRRGRITRLRRASGRELDPPRRAYNEDLVHHYLLAVSSESPLVQYLSYYHILEHFFESVFNDDLLENIKNVITHPGFSYKRKKDISTLVTTIKRALQIRSDSISFSESEALRLCISKFINIVELQLRINEYDGTLLEYYSTTKVPFSEGSTIDFSSGDIEKIGKELTRRIYSTRNSLVHSKDGDKAKYMPFRDDKLLLIEIPLMRFMAEMVILHVSEVL